MILRTGRNEGTAGNRDTFAVGEGYKAGDFQTAIETIATTSFHLEAKPVVSIVSIVVKKTPVVVRTRSADFATAGADGGVGGVEYAELAGGNALDGGVGNDAERTVGEAGHVAGAEALGVAYLEEDVGFGEAGPRVGGDAVEADETEFLAVKAVAGVGVGDVDDVAPDVFVDHEPWAAAEAEAFALADGVEPVAVMLSDDVARFALDDVALPLTEKGAEVVGVVDFAEEADALAVAAVGGGEVFALGDVAHFVLEEVADGETEFAGLHVGEL